MGNGFGLLVLACALLIVLTVAFIRDMVRGGIDRARWVRVILSLALFSLWGLAVAVSAMLLKQ